MERAPRPASRLPAALLVVVALIAVCSLWVAGDDAPAAAPSVLVSGDGARAARVLPAPAEPAPAPDASVGAAVTIADAPIEPVVPEVPSAAVLSGTARLAGCVLGPDAPVPGAMVSLWEGAYGGGRNRGAPSRRTVSDEHGRYRFDAVAAGTHLLVAQDVELGTSNDKLVHVSSGDGAVDDIELRVPAEGRVVGTVYAFDGTPIGRDDVSLRRDPNGEPRQARADAEGAFAFERVPPGRYVLSVPPLPGDVLEVLSRRTTRHDLRVAQRPLVYGRVTTGGRPVSGARVLARFDDAGIRAPAIPSTHTDVDGRYELYLPRTDATYEVTVGSFHMSSCTPQRVRLGSGQAVLVDFELVLED